MRCALRYTLAPQTYTCNLNYWIRSEAFDNSPRPLIVVDSKVRKSDLYGHYQGLQFS